jgi:RNA-binding protein 39
LFAPLPPFSGDERAHAHGDDETQDTRHKRRETRDKRDEKRERERERERETRERDRERETERRERDERDRERARARGDDERESAWLGDERVRDRVTRWRYRVTSETEVVIWGDQITTNGLCADQKCIKSFAELLFFPPK